MDEWRHVVAEMRKAEDPWQSPAIGRFYELAHAFGRALLARRGLNQEDIEDLVCDLLSFKLREIVESADAKPYFCTCLKNKATSWQRKKLSRVVEDRPLDAPGESQTTTEDARFEARERLGLVASLLSDREQEVLAAVNLGTDRNELAASLDVKRAAVDQIVSRARAKLKKAELP